MARPPVRAASGEVHREGALKLVPLTHFNFVHKAKTALKECQTCATINDEQYTLSKPVGPTGSNVSQSDEFNPATDIVTPFWFLPFGSPGDVNRM